MNNTKVYTISIFNTFKHHEWTFARLTISNEKYIRMLLFAIKAKAICMEKVKANEKWCFGGVMHIRIRIVYSKGI